MTFPRSREKGQAIIMMTFGAIAMFGVIGLVVDIGWGYFVRQSAIAAAQSAAMGAAVAGMKIGSYNCGTGGVTCQATATACANPVPNPPTNNIQNGCLYASGNGFVAGGSQNVTMQSGASSSPPTASGVSAVYWVTARVSQSVPQLFSSVFGNRTLNVSARATAAVVGGAPAGCVYVLDPSASQAFFVSGAHAATSCGIWVASTNSQAMVVNGSGSVVVSGGSGINVAGGYAPSGQVTVTPTPTTGVTGITDPLANVAAPTYSNTCYQTNFNWSQGSTTINPGVYCGGIRIMGGTVTVNPGTYVLMGGGLTIGSANTTVTGSGVTFYNTQGNGYSYSPITITGQPNVTFSAPTSGALEGIIMFQDRTLSHSTVSGQNQINGSTQSVFTGTFYFPTSPLLYTGQSSSGVYTGIVVGTFIVNGQTNFQQDLTGQYTGLSQKKVALIE